MKKSITLPVPNSLVLIMDHATGEPPQAMDGRLVAFTGSCIAVGTMSETDGKTTVTLTDSLDGIERGELVFDGVLASLQSEISVCNVANEKLLTMRLTAPEAHVQIYANDPSEPDSIVVLVHQTFAPPSIPPR